MTHDELVEKPTWQAKPLFSDEGVPVTAGDITAGMNVLLVPSHRQRINPCGPLDLPGTSQLRFFFNRR